MLFDDPNIQSDHQIILRRKDRGMNDGELEVGRPVASLDIEFEWHKGIWLELFNKHVDFIQLDILRALASNKLVVYLSCPISSRAGSYFATNVEIATFTRNRLSAEWGPRFWFLNPAEYQMESAQGLGLIRRHAYELGLEKHTTIDVDGLMKERPPVGGDYMHMWTRVLAEDGKSNLGDRFSAFYFLSPSDVKAFFMRSGAKDVTVGVESDFSTRFNSDSTFQEYFSLPLKDERGNVSTEPHAVQEQKLAQRRHDFVRFYTVRASAYFSKGSHDEWNIWQKLNAIRIAQDEKQGYGMGSQISGFYEALQISPGSAERSISPGYAVNPQKTTDPTLIVQTARATAAVDRLAEHQPTRKA